MRAWLVFLLFSLLAVCFTLDPTPTVAEDTTDKKIVFYHYNTSLTDNNNSNTNDQKKNSDVKHFCPKCESHSLTFEGISMGEGKQIQLINCSDCDYEWQETWTLPNWLWLKSSSPNNHWTSDKWSPK
jgi:DNA-directed RNA polymerase subunit M/transcription elongation factor TFIIS